MFGFKNNEQLTDFSFSVKNSYAINYKAYSMKPHSHDSLEIIYCEQGACEVACYREDSKIIHALKKNHCIVINPNVPHALHIKEGNNTRILALEITLAPKRLIETSEILKQHEVASVVYSENKGFFTVYDDKYIIGDFYEILAELSPARTTCEDYVQILVTKLLVDLARNYGLYHSSDVFHVQKALEFIQENFIYDISVSDIASAVKLHQSYLQKQIKKHTDKSIVEHINTFRTERAKTLIEHTNTSLTQISAECGYCNRQTFYNAFKKYVGINPREYKNRVAAQKASELYRR